MPVVFNNRHIFYVIIHESDFDFIDPGHVFNLVKYL